MIENIHIKGLLLLVAPLVVLFFYPLYAKKRSLSKGDIAPDFRLTGTDGKQHQLKDFLHHGNRVALVFYPQDDSRFCTQELCALRDDFSTLKANNITVIGISKDSYDSHLKFKTAHEYPFLLLSDPTEKTIKQYHMEGSLKTLFFNKRGTFLINTDGTIKAFINSVDIKNHATQIINTFNSL